MKQALKILLTILTMIIVTACADDSLDLALLQRCESVAYNRPRLALERLDSINFPEAFDKVERYRYLLRMNQVRNEVGEKVTVDLLAPEATSYFERKEQWEYAALSEYAKGLVWMDKEQYKQAATCFKNAMTFAEQAGNPALNGLLLLEMGKLHLKCSEWAMADATLQRARACFQRTKNASQEVETLLMLGEIREQIADFKMAKSFFVAALSRSAQPELMAKCQLALCQLNYILDQKDSLNSDAEKLGLLLPKVVDPSVRSSGWQFLAQWYQETGNSNEARIANEQVNRVLQELIFGKGAHRLLDETAKLDRIRSLYNDRMRHRKIWMNSLIVLSMLVIVYVLYRNKRQRLALLDAESKVKTLQTLAMEFNRKEDSLRQLALKHFDILKKVALLDGMMKDLKTGQEKKIHSLFNQAVYENNSDFDWDTFFRSINQLKDGIPEKVKSFYPQLTETEYRILILSFTGLSNKETSIILNLSTNTINSLRTSIRRKIQVPEYGDLEEFVTNQLKS